MNKRADAIRPYECGALQKQRGQLMTVPVVLGIKNYLRTLFLLFSL